MSRMRNDQRTALTDEQRGGAYTPATHPDEGQRPTTIPPNNRAFVSLTSSLTFVPWVRPDHARTGRFAALAGSWRSRGTDHSHLEHRGEVVACRPVLAELPPSNSIPVALLGHEALVGRRREAAKLAKVGTRGADADGDHVGVGDDLFNRHLEVGELCPKPCDHLPGVRRTLDRARLLPAEWLHRVLEVLLGHDVVGGTEIPGGEDLVEQPHDESLVVLRQSFLLAKRPDIADRMTLMS